MSKFAKFALSALLSFVFTNTVIAAPLTAKDVTECDRLAADPEDQNRIALAVFTKEMSAIAALKACQSAYENDPTNLRLIHQYGRTLLVNDRMEGLEILTLSAEKEYVASQKALGHFFYTESSPQRDYEKSFHWFQRAANNGDQIV
ncbi:MAG: hypothetical protein HN403_19095 [Rhodospirillales bacterium]|jgi:TPR repeat protein|nr:hypothetical protein [Rhodospirillales bacterium]